MNFLNTLHTNTEKSHVPIIKITWILYVIYLQWSGGFYSFRYDKANRNSNKRLLCNGSIRENFQFTVIKRKLSQKTGNSRNRFESWKASLLCRTLVAFKAILSNLFPILVNPTKKKKKSLCDEICFLLFAFENPDSLPRAGS